MARNENRDGIGRAGACYRTHRRGLPDARGDLRVTRSRAQRVRSALVEPAAGIESSAIDGLGNGPTGAQFRAHSFGLARRRILSWRDADHLFEHAKEMVTAQPGGIG